MTTEELEDRLERLSWRLKSAEMFISKQKMLYDYAEWAVSSDNWYPLNKQDEKYLYDLTKKHLESESE